jgi:hypothetical protein
MPCRNEQGQSDAVDAFKKITARAGTRAADVKKVASEIPKIGTSPLNMRPFVD